MSITLLSVGYSYTGVILSSTANVVDGSKGYRRVFLSIGLLDSILDTD